MVAPSSSRVLRARSVAANPTSGEASTAALAVICAGALCASFALTPTDAASGPVICPFRLMTGLPCPGCGLTRGWVFLAHGRVGAAISANPFALLTMPAALAFVVAVVVAVVRRRPLPDLTRAARLGVVKVVVVAWVAFALVRALAVLTGHATV